MDDSIITAYEEAFPESKFCFFSPCGNAAVIDFENNREYVMPDEETEESFMDRITRSQEAGRNLFFEEWPPLVREWETDPDVKL